MSQKRLKVGATPGKLALIGVLALAMVIVTASNWPSAPAPPVDVAATAPVPTPSGLPPTTEGIPNTQEAAPAGPFGQFAEDRHWPELPLDEVTAFDPFATSAWAAPLAAAAEGPAYNQEQINELFAAENAIILVAGDKRIASIGDREYKIGDVIGRFRISDISSRGVVLSEAQ